MIKGNTMNISVFIVFAWFLSSVSLSKKFNSEVIRDCNNRIHHAVWMTTVPDRALPRGIGVQNAKIKSFLPAVPL
jgi:hypothetical protein